MARWRLLLSLLFGFGAMFLCFVAGYEYAHRIDGMLMTILALLPLLLCMTFAQDDGVRSLLVPPEPIAEAESAGESEGK